MQHLKMSADILLEKGQSEAVVSDHADHFVIL